MYLAELNLNTVSIKQQFELPEGYWQTDRSKYTLQQIGDMPHWINIQKGIWSTKTEYSNMVDLNSLNPAQRMAYDIVEQHFLFGNEQLFMIITGLAGSGKSYVIDAIKSLLKQNCKVCAFFGIAAFNVGGTTLHSLLRPPIKGKKNCPLQSSALSRLQRDRDCEIFDY